MRQMQAKRPRTILLNSAATVALIAALSGCATTMDSSGRSASSTRTAYTPAEKQLRQESSLFSKTSAQGCLAGAVAGALIGLLATHNSNDNRNRNRALALGAAGGCAAGVGANAYVQNKRGQYRDNEARMNAMIADVRKDNQQLARLIELNRTVIAEDKRKIAQVKANLRDKQISSAQARAELARVRENRSLLANQINDAKEKQQEWVDISQVEQQAGANTVKLDSEIGTLKKQIASLEAEAALIDREIAATPAAA